MNYYFAPLEGITGWLYRQAYHTCFQPLDKYFSPFLSPNREKGLSSRDQKDVLPEHNEGLYLVPQILTNRADDFVRAARLLKEYGYREVNLNLGCPSGTVVSKFRGSGFLAKPRELNNFLDEIFYYLDLKISVKTRIGKDSPEEFAYLLEVFNRYPLEELIIHPRIQQDHYRNHPNLSVFRTAFADSRSPVCYNGDLFTQTDVKNFSSNFPEAKTIMLGRGLIANPALTRELAGGKPLEKAELRGFLDRLFTGYRGILYGDRAVLSKMKELWHYMIFLFDDPVPFAKQIRKSQTAASYEDAVNALFRERDLTPGGGYLPC